MNPLSPELPSRFVQILRTASRITVLTGAGISAESGVPTFRDAQTGLWARYRPEELADRNPRLVWDWYTWRRERVAKAHPNAGHLALAEMEKRVPQFTLVTQNVDGLHRRAGSQNVIELHGNITRTKCFREDVMIEAWADTGETPPRCPRCSSPLRPDVVWFGEALPADALGAAIEASRSCDVFFSIGTSSVVEPAASLPHEALRHGATVVEVNSDETPLTPRATFVLRDPAGVVVPAFVLVTWKERPNRQMHS